MKVCPGCGKPVRFTSDHFDGARFACEPEPVAPRPELTPREEFESMFGPIIDEQWQWLTEFVSRRYVPAGRE